MGLGLDSGAWLFMVGKGMVEKGWLVVQRDGTGMGDGLANGEDEAT
jgi:hypothetical protein